MTTYVVRMDWDDSILYHDGTPDGWSLRDNIKSWLFGNIGKGKFQWDIEWKPDAKAERGGTWALFFMFWDPTLAMMFRLAWGGNEVSIYNPN